MMKKPLLIFFFGSVLLFTGCGGGSGSTTPSAQELAIKKIANYAEDDTNFAPTIKDYTDAGLTGVDEEKLTKLNKLVKELTYEDVDTKEELQKLLSSIDVIISNHIPTANSQTIMMSKNTTKQILLTGSDADGDALTYRVVTQPTHGTYANGVYTPEANYNGTDSFTFKANDGKTDSAPATISITITDVPEPNHAPTATPQSVTLDEDTTKAITLSGSDADGDTLTYTVCYTTNSWNLYKWSLYTRSKL